MSQAPVSQADFSEVLKLIQSHKQKLVVQANHVQLDTYWQVGAYLSHKVANGGWGKGVVKELAEWLKKQDADLKGFSPQNLWRMKQFFETYAEDQKLSPAVRELPQDVTGVFKDSYLIDFAGLSEPHLEKDLETKMIPKALLKQKLHEWDELFAQREDA